MTKALIGLKFIAKNKMIKYKDYYNYLNESIVKRVDIENLLPDKNNMEVAVDSLRKGMRAPSNSPIEV